MSPISRRGFLRTSAALGSAALADVASPLVAAPKKPDANDTLQVAVLGVRGRGMSHVKDGFAGKNGCRVAVICDPDAAVIGPAMRAAENAQGHAPRYERDLRRVLDDHSIDVVSIATPNHWHALAAVWAMQAGKDVYVEKPVSHNVREGRRLVQAAQRYGRVCQAGTQSRSNPGMRRAIEFLRSGGLGRVRVARGLCYKPRPSIGKAKGDVRPPATVDYDLWCGPAPLQPLHRRNLHYDWHWFWDYGNGDLGNQGIHQMDIARWGLGKTALAHSVVSIGGRFGYSDDGETPNTQICVFDYGDSELIFEVRGLPTRRYRGAAVGNVFHAEKGYLVCPSYAAATAFSPDGKAVEKFDGAGDHFANFILAVRGRKPQDLHADALEGHLSSALCHLGNISYRLGTLEPLRKKEHALGDDRDAFETLARMEDHLKDNGVPVDGTKYRVGRRLRCDPKAESFYADAEADALLMRPYRAPFTLPDVI